MLQVSNTPISSDEIDILVLIKALWVRKWIVVSVTVLVTIVSAVYAFAAEPLYEARIYVLPPAQSNIADFNYGRTLNSDLPLFSVKDVYDVFVRNLFSESLRRSFFEEVYLPSLTENARQGSRDRLYQKFSKQLVISSEGKESPDRYSVTVQSGNPSEAGEWVRTYVKNAGVTAKSELIKNVVREAQVRARNLEQQINGLRESTRREREDKIKVLSEALVIARAIGLNKPVIISGKTPGELSLGVDSQALYMRGSDALQAEIEGLENRESDDPFIQNLRVLQVKYSFLKNLTVDSSGVSVYRQDGAVDDPDSPIKPNKLSILIQGACFGLFLGLVLALFGYVAPLLRAKILIPSSHP
ncbi:LPS O-antigen chain length determinant protein WzzB [Pseudomonas fluorescens]|uniref:Chain-length determining protein n=1 Tax=Pseudomonas fluorescens TaxID=294 RepID=A0A0F4TEE7_PSEFL|nr:Wzz/FepE/Etk N-terminal domain-containing protein [Pseudomonas fluorescens]KJZ42821.1 chain-length determining protein [Pseudomonas fluorescens]